MVSYNILFFAIKIECNLHTSKKDYNIYYSYLSHLKQSFEKRLYIVNFVSILLYKNVIDKGYAEIFYKIKSFVFFLEYIYIYIYRLNEMEWRYH